MKYGLLGRKLGHSYSPQIHRQLGSYSYKLFQVEPDDLGTFLCDGDFAGLNVTIPYKKDVIPYCSELSPVAKELGAVNTIIRRPDGSLAGHNTDYYGFCAMLKQTGLIVQGKKVLVLGTGGASVTVCAVLREQNANVIVVSRNGKNNYQNLSQHSDAAVIVNATPVGMYPNPGLSPIDISQFPQLEGVLDVIYNPARTQLLMDAEQRGLIAQNGLFMLVAQAKESAEWFQEREIAECRIHQIHSALRRQMENIVLIGMPGCGKTSVGKMLAGALGKRFVDADAVIVEKAGRSIPDIFANSGEAAFRDLESKVLEELGMQSGLVIATGGGCVTREENYPLLHQNGTIYWLQRDIAALPKDGRPLSLSSDLMQMYAKRKPMYARFSDYTIRNCGTIDDAVKQIENVEASL